MSKPRRGQIAKTLRPGQLVVLESTTYPGTTRDVMLPILAATGLTVGEDFFLAYSPEREDPGNINFSASGIPKVVGGIDPLSAEIANAMYSQAVVRTVPVSYGRGGRGLQDSGEHLSFREHRDGQRAEGAVRSHRHRRVGSDRSGQDEAVRVPGRFTRARAWAGIAFPIDPFYLSWVARKYEMSTRFIELAGEINTSMPKYVIGRTIEALNSVGKPMRGSRVGVLGVAYKKDVDDPRESPSFKLMELLQASGAIISYNDPHIPVLPAMRHFDVPRLASETLTPEYLASLDCVLIATDHSAYDYDFIVRYAPLVVDSRNATKDVQHSRGKIWKA